MFGLSACALLAERQRLAELVARVRQRALADQRLDVLRVAGQRRVEGRLGLAIVGRVAGLARPLEVGGAQQGVGIDIVGVLAHAALVVPDQPVGPVRRSLVGRGLEALDGDRRGRGRRCSAQQQRRSQRQQPEPGREHKMI